MFDELDDGALHQLIVDAGHEYLEDFDDPGIYTKVDRSGRRRRVFGGLAYVGRPR